MVNSTSVSHISYFKNSIYFSFCQPYFHNFNIQQCCSHSHASHSNMLSKQSSLSIFPVVFLPMKCQSHTHLLSPISGVMIPDHHSRDQTAADTDTCHRHPTENTDGKQYKGTNRTVKMRIDHDHQGKDQIQGCQRQYRKPERYQPQQYPERYRNGFSTFLWL